MLEIMVVLAVIGALAAFGIIIGLDSYSRYNFHAESDTVVAMLQKARSEAINNIGGVRHGVYFGDAADLILFSGSTYSPPAYETKLAKNPVVVYNYSACTGNQVVFDQLSGKPASIGCQIVLQEGLKSVTITINNESGIDY